MEAEAREILRSSLELPEALAGSPEALIAARRRRIEAVVGVWQKPALSTDKIMRELRGDE